MSPELTANRTLPADDVRNEAVELLEGLVDESVGGYRVNRTMLLDAILYAAAEGTSLHGACGMLDGMADDTTLRDHLNAAFPASSAFDLNRRAKSVLLASAPKAVFKRKQEIAIDSKDFPYYGQHPGLEPWICRGQARAGTTRFLRIATAYVMRHGQRVTLAAIQVSKGMTLGEVVRDLVGHLRFFGVKIASLYLDRGFASVEVIRTIEQLRMPAVIACPVRGTDQSGVRQFCTGRSSHIAHHVFHSRHGAALATLAVVRSYTGGRRTKKRARWFVYIVIGRSLKPQDAHRAYRFRFGIETSYRVLNQIRPRTTSRNPAIRFLLVLAGLLLANLWVGLKRIVCRRMLPPRGFRTEAVEHFDEARLRLHRLKTLLRYAIEQRYGLQLVVMGPAS
jgi:putative transposase